MTKSYTTKSRILIYIGVVIISLAACSVFAYSIAPHWTGGDSGFYIGNAQEILNRGISWYMDMASVFYYWGYPSFIALCFAIFGENLTAVVVVQIILKALSMILLVKTIERVCGNIIIGGVLASFYSIIMDCFMWDPRILSDGMGMFWECVTLYFFTRCYLSEEREKWYIYLALILSMFLFFITRTNAIALVVILIIFMFFKLPQKPRRIIGFSFLGIVVVVLIGMWIVGQTQQHGLSNRLSYYIEYFENGWVVAGRPETYYNVDPSHIGTPAFIGDCIAMFFLKIAWFWSLFFSEYSLSHKLIECVTLIPVFAVSIFSVVFIIKEKAKKYYPFIFGVVSYTIVQALTEVEYDQRYRAPVFLLMMVICAYGIQKIVEYRTKKHDFSN